MKKKFLWLFITVLFLSIGKAMPLREDVIQHIKQLPEKKQSGLLKIPEGVNMPPARRTGGPRIVQSAACVILVDFTDNEADPSHTPSQYADLLFSSGTYPTGSMKDYYDDVSYQQFTLSGDVSDTWLRMPQSYAYYVDGNRGFGAYPRNAMKMVEDAIAAADPYIDFSLFDTDDDHFVDALFVVHAGPGFEETGNPDMIHSHMWDLHASPQGPYLTDDGVFIGLYCIEPEEHSNGTLISIGVFCHEFGHILGLPDLYDTDYDSEGIGNWGLMGGGAWGGNGMTPDTPVHLCAWSKKELGWIDPTTIIEDTPGLTIPSIETEPVAYRFVESEQEYFIVENREKIGFDKYLYGSGLLIWHIDETMSGNDYPCLEDICPSHYKVALVQADGRRDLEWDINRGDNGDPYPGSTGNRFFNNDTTPHSRDYTGRPTWVALNNISDAAAEMTLDVGLSPTRPFFLFTAHRMIGDDDGDGYPDAGEHMSFEITLENCGTAQPGVSGILTAGGTVNVIKGDAVFGDFDRNERRSNADDLFEIFVPPQVSRGFRESFSLSLTGEGGYTQTVSFYLTLAPLPIDVTPGWESPPGYAVSGASEDIDGDGLTDFVLARYMDSHAVYFNTGNGLELSAGWTNTDTSGGYARKTLPVDISGDGYPELVFVNVELDPVTYEYYPSQSILYKNTTGMPEKTVGWVSNPHTAADAATGDIDGDGHPDLIIGCLNEQDVLYRGLAGGLFESEPSWQSSAACDTFSVTLADVDNDGDLDLITGRKEGPLQVYMNRDGHLETAPSWVSDSHPAAFALATGDMDLDGDLDLAVGVYNGADLIFRNDGGVFRKSPCWSSEDADTTTAVAWSDIDEDGYPELLATRMEFGDGNQLPGNLSNVLYYNTGGILTTYAAWTSHEQRVSFGGGFADFNSDEHNDVYCINFSGASTIYYNHVGDCSVLGVALIMPSRNFTAGDPCYLTANLCNPGRETMRNIPFFVLLDVYGDYWFAPSWVSDGEGIDWYTLNLLPGQTTMTIIPEFIWPSDVSGTADGLRFWGALTDASITTILGEMDVWEFGYH